jgi:hypothetical protein
MSDLNTKVHRLMDMSEWKRTFNEVGGAPHPAWKSSSVKYPDEGFWPHVHLICRAIRKPNFESMTSAWARVVGATSGDDILHHKPIDSAKQLRSVAKYTTNIGKILPAYSRWYDATRPKGERERVLTERLKPLDVVNFIRAGHRARKIIRHFDDSLLPPAGYRLPKEKP